MTLKHKQDNRDVTITVKCWHKSSPAALVRHEYGFLPTFLIQPHRVKKDLQRGKAESPKIQICKACSIVPNVHQLRTKKSERSICKMHYFTFKQTGPSVPKGTNGYLICVS